MCRTAFPWLVCGLVVVIAFESCSQSIGIQPPASSATAQDLFWSKEQLTQGVNYDILRNGVGRDHRLFSIDGSHVEDGALNNEVTMVVHCVPDSVLIDSMGTNSIFDLPTGYYFGNDSMPGVPGSLRILYRPGLDSGGTWPAGILSGPGLQHGVPIIATVLDHVDSLRLPPASPGADSAFGESFQIRYAPENFSDSVSAFPIYWIAYYCRNVGPVLIQQYSLRLPGKYSLTESVQIVGQAP